jgi:ABC-type multidrug transport system ATPase subunit
MELIVLRGERNVGKTHTINIVYQRLLQDGYEPVEGHFLVLNDASDFRDILQKGDKRIGIVSMGDYGIGGCSVKAHLQYFASQNCQKAITACTTEGTTKKIEAVEKFSLRELHGETKISSTLHLINKPRINDPARYEIEYTEKANEIIRYV